MKLYNKLQGCFTTKIILFLILLLGTILRFYNLNSVPPSVSIDEASIGYNAYSVLKTGVDEFGRFPIIYQRGYDDWRRSTYLFLTIPTVAVFGLTAFAVRLPSVILSVLTIWAAYKIVLLLFSKKSEFAEYASLVSAFLLAISPWHIYISRLGHESNAYVSFFVLGFLFFLEGLKNEKKFFLSLIFFTLSMISYYSGQIFIPLFVLGLIIIYRKEILKIVLSKKRTVILFLCCLIILIPITWSIFSPDAINRFNGVSTFSPEAHGQLFNQMVSLRNKAAKEHNIFGLFFYNRRFYPVLVFFQGYFSHFNLFWLFTNSSDEPFKAPGTGLLYLWELPFILIGIFSLIFAKSSDPKIKKMIFIWFFLAFLPAAVATQAPHANRTYIAVVAWEIFSAVGIVYAVSALKKIRLLVIPLIAVLAIVGLINFCRNYFILFPKEQSHSFSYSVSQAIPYVLSKQKNFKRIIFSNTDSLYQSYMVFLFDSRFDPVLYQKLGGTKSAGFAQTHAFLKYEFRPINWLKDQEISDALLIGNASEFSKTVKGKIFTDLDGKGKIKIVEISQAYK